MEQVELVQYWAVIRRWLWLIVLTTLIAALSALVVSLNMHPVYKATAQILIQRASNPTDVATYSDVLTSERLARTYAKLLTTRPILEQTVEELGLSASVDVDALKRHISVSPVRDTTLVELGVEDTDPSRAVALANKIPEVFAQYNEKVQRGRFQESKTSLQEQMKRIETDLAEKQSQLARLRSDPNADPADIMRLETQVTSLQTSYANLLQQFEAIRLAEAQSLNTVVVSEPAVEAVKVRPRTLLNTVLAALVGLMLGLGAAFLLEYLDDTVKTPDDIARISDVPVLAGIAEVEEDEHMPLIVHTRPKSPVSEAFRMLRTNMQFAGVDTPLRTIVITSPGPAEGKSFITANLGIVMAQLGHKVAIVDADLRKPMQHTLFRLPKNVGLTNVLVSNPEVRLEDVLRETEIPNLWVLTCGPIPPNPSELLGSRRMSEVIAEMLNVVDIVLFDTPPALAVTDASVLARSTDGVLVVAQVGHTRQPALFQTLAELSRVDARMLGIVLNKLPSRGSRYYSYYHYYSHYYHYYPDGEKEHSFRRFRLPIKTTKRKSQKSEST